MDGETETRCAASWVWYAGALVSTCRFRVRAGFAFVGATLCFGAVAEARAGALLCDFPAEEAWSACGAPASRTGESGHTNIAAAAAATSAPARAAPPAAQRTLGHHDRRCARGGVALPGRVKPSSAAQKPTPP